MLWPSVKFFCLSPSSHYDRIHTEDKLFDAELFQECCHFPYEKLNISDEHNSIYDKMGRFQYFVQTDLLSV
jgi:hypothetical protein